MRLLWSWEEWYYVHHSIWHAAQCSVSCCYAAAAIIQIRGQIYTHGPRDEEKYMKITSGNANSKQAVLELAAMLGVRYPLLRSKKKKKNWIIQTRRNKSHLKAVDQESPVVITTVLHYHPWPYASWSEISSQNAFSANWWNTAPRSPWLQLV